MEKSQEENPRFSHIETFTFNNEKWIMQKNYGQVYLIQEERTCFYVMDREASSVFSVSLMTMALRKVFTEEKVSYTMEVSADIEKVLITLKTKLETLTYNFYRRQYDHYLLMIDEIKALQARCHRCEEVRPLVGMATLKKWIEFAPQDIVADFDYAFLKLKDTPVVFAELYGHSGYIAVHQKTKDHCKLFIHSSSLVNLPGGSSFGQEPIIHYCIFPEGIAAPKVPEPEEELKEELNSYEAVVESVRKGRQLVVYEDQVLDVKKFFERHPGGPGMIKPVIGREIGRWVYGAMPAEGGSGKHAHSFKAIDLINKYQVGKIPCPVVTQGVFTDVNDEKPLSNFTFKLINTDGLTDVHLLCKFRNPLVKLKPLLNKVELFGYYYAITSLAKNITRNYFMNFAIDENIINHHIKLCKAIEEKGDFATEYPEMDKVLLEDLSVVAKRKGEMTFFMAGDENAGSEFKIKGPFGHGLGLEGNQKGPIVALCGGTSMVCFMDLVAYLIRMNAQKVGEKVKKNYKIFADETFEELRDPSFKFILCGSFRTKSEVPYASLLASANNIAKTNGFENFEFNLRLAEAVPKQGHWDEDFLTKKVPKKASKIYIVGSSGFVTSVEKALLTAGYDPHTFVFLQMGSNFK